MLGILLKFYFKKSEIGQDRYGLIAIERNKRVLFLGSPRLILGLSIVSHLKYIYMHAHTRKRSNNPPLGHSVSSSVDRCRFMAVHNRNGTNVTDNGRFIRKLGGREAADHYAAHVVIFHYRGCRLQMQPPRLVRRTIRNAIQGAASPFNRACR